MYDVIICVFTTIRHFIKEKGTGTEIRPAIDCGIVTGDLPVPSNSPRSLSSDQVPSCF